MIVDLNITEYIRSLMKEEKNDLSKIEAEARVNHVPVSYTHLTLPTIA